ncbi:hypothetical protein Daus18300_000181 [Diaporthe australafricana]|uniref:Cytochrome P450 n=1 Tax=Diaporthe australafricana TaxID=127596 RepID=A0ABR3Y711_9PEZI
MAYTASIPLIIIAVLVFRLRNVGRRPKNLPPGPPTMPLIGNLHLMPQEHPHVQFKKWAEEYGPIYSLILGTNVMIVLSSDEVIKDLLDKRSGIYSSRPDIYLGNVASGWLRVVLMKYGEQWRMIRKIMHSILHLNASKGYVPYQDLESKQMLCGILDDPLLFADHIRRFTNSLTTQMVFGFRTVDIHDENLHKLYDGMEKWGETVASSTAAFLDVFPILRKLPDFMLPMRRYAQELHKKEKALYVGHWMDTKRQILEGTAKTASTLHGFVQAMVLYPNAQKLAQQELDEVCGDRLPTIEDWATLPYVRKCVKEALRWMPTAILGLPHAVTQDDEYRGYKIPKGAGVMCNVWAVNMDSNRFDNPRAFDPSRYEGDDQTSAEAAMNGDAHKRDHYVFGAGRRLCQGMHIADRSLFLSISRLLWAFNLEKAVDTEGNEIEPDQDNLTEGILVQPAPFPAKITPRSEKHVQAIRQEWEECQPLLDDTKQWKEVPKGMVFKDYNPSELKD